MMRFEKQENNLYNIYKDNGSIIPNLIGKKHTDPNRMKAEVKRLYLIKNIDGVVKIHSYYHNMIFLEKIEGEDLYNVLERRKTLPEEEVRHITTCLLKIIKNLHDINVIHGDIKPENIMYNENTRDVTLIDFEYRQHTASYAAPETIKYKKYDNKTDVWGIGVTIYTLLMGHIPFNNSYHLFSGIPYHSMSLYISSNARSFIKSTLMIEYSFRITIEECLEHRWIYVPVCPIETNSPISYAPFETIEYKNDSKCDWFKTKCCVIC